MEDLEFTLDEAFEAFFEPCVEESTVLPAVKPAESAAEECGEPAPEAWSPDEPLPEPPAQVAPEGAPAPSVEPAEPAEAALLEAEDAPGGRAPEPSGAFEVPLLLVWNLWREAYLRVYGRPYVQTAADRAASRELAGACGTAVLHHERRAGLGVGEREKQAQAYLRHVFVAFLKRPGRKDFLRERRHPLHLLLEDLNALGEPWGKVAKAPEAPAPLPPPLPRKEQLAWCQKIQEALNEGRIARPRIVRRG